ncbi:MAG: 50S ribosomal protein L3 [Halobacteriota archaeon]
MTKRHRPRRGSLAFSPRKRAQSEVPRMRSWAQQNEPHIQGFAGYKAGMTHAVMIDDTPNSPTEGTEISVPVTVIETPLMKVAGVRAYGDTPYGRQIRSETWASSVEGDLARRRPLPKGKPNTEAEVDGEDEIRVLAYTSPAAISGVPKKVPDLMEIPVGGSDAKAAHAYAQDMLGKEVKAVDVFKPGMLVDVAAVTKGKGTQGPVKRWGVTIQDRKAFRGGKGRHVGNLGPWNPARVRWTVPQLGQMGYQQRTEYNKRVLKIGSDGADVTPAGGFVSYGIVQGEYVLLHGSIPGPAKRLVRLRPAIRSHGKVQSAPELRYISLQSKQGVR